jgi:hypothetical protein
MKALVLSGMLALFALLGAADSHAVGMYCDDALVMEGMSKLEVMSKCGEPDSKEVASVNTFGTAVRGAFPPTTSAVEVWQYNCGTGKMNRTLYFDADKLARIEYGKSYGSGPEKCA